MRIGIDAMGGDNAPREPVAGALAACELLAEDDRIVLVGDESTIREQLAGHDGWADHIEIVHADETIGMDEAPVEALRTKPHSSIALLAQGQADGRMDALISAGNTGAVVAAAQMRLRRLKGVHRPGISILMPTSHGPVALCDVGANVSCRPQHLHQYGVMASLYVNSLYGLERPRVALLNVGSEDAKGNELVKRTRELLQGDPNIHFVGNVEGRDIFSGVCDVVLCEGFVGNVVLKLMEGMARALIRTLVGQLIDSLPDQEALVKRAAQTLLRSYDFNEYGGAPLLGVAGITIICHGASSARGIMNAVRVAIEFSKHHVNEQITELLRQSRGIAHA